MCAGCGKKIVWGITPDGKKIPLDPSAAIYRSGEGLAASYVVLVPAADRKDKGPWVSHFATCPKASQFSGSREPKAVPDESKPQEPKGPPQ